MNSSSNNSLQGLTDASTNTGNPQQAPGNLQPNGSQDRNLQGVLTVNQLLSNPQNNAIVKVPGVTTAQELVAKDASTSQPANTPAINYVIFVVMMVLLVFAGFVMLKRLIQDEV